jgi:murein DD-endopeptidase MepM/ murein hydrolase activator NlpD
MNGIDSIAARLGAAPETGADRERELKKAAAEFESLFLNQMLKTMRKTIEKSELFHGGRGEEIYTSMLDEELSKSMAGAGGIGLGDVLLRQLAGSETSSAPGPGAAPAPGALGKVRAYMSQGLKWLRRPIDGLVSSVFGPRKDPITGEAGFHHGMDIAAPEGTPIYPAAPGRVAFSGEIKGYGNVVDVEHGDGFVTRYAHTQKNIVKQGDAVDTSGPIAYVGSTGRSTGAHLHFELLKDGESVDPGDYIRG